MKNNKTVGIRRLIWDLETSPNVVLAFRAGYDLTINPEAIIAERKVICVSYKWVGEKKVHNICWDENQDDKALLTEFMVVANEADEMIAHFGDKYDLPWFRTRCLIHGLNPLPTYKTIDTKAWASRNFCFNSNKLQYLSTVLGFGGKDKMEFDDWKKIVLYKCEKSLNKMCRYCDKDVIRLEEVYLKFQPWIKPKTHAGVFAGGDKWTCPRTGSKNVAHSKRRVTSAGTVTHSMQNQDDGTYFQISDQAFNRFVDYKSGLSKVRCPAAPRNSRR